MAKYYVQSGTFRRVVAADSCRKAALWAVHEVMKQIMPNDLDGEYGVSNAHFGPENGKGSNEQVQSVTVLSAKVRVDERGFDRDDARELSTMEVMAEWNQMVMTLDRLQRMLDGTAISPPKTEDRFSGHEYGGDHLFGDLAA